MSSENFRLYSAYYNLLYKDKDYKGEVNYIESLFTKFSITKIRSILNLGCGTGNHDLLFAERNYDVLGVDISEGMIDTANKRITDLENSKISFSKADIRNFRSQKKFDAVLSLFHVMSYQTADKDLEQVFQTANEHLSKGGLFIFDCWHGPAVLADPPIIKIKEVEDEQIEVKRKATPVIHTDEKVVDVNFEILVKDKKTGEEQKFNELHRMRYLFEAELNKISAGIGFSNKGSFRWLSKDLPDTKSWNVVYIFQKN